MLHACGIEYGRIWLARGETNAGHTLLTHSHCWRPVWSTLVDTQESRRRPAQANNKHMRMMLLIPSLPWRLLCAKSEASNVSHASNFELGFTITARLYTFDFFYNIIHIDAYS